MDLAVNPYLGHFKNSWFIDWLIDNNNHFTAFSRTTGCAGTRKTIPHINPQYHHHHLTVPQISLIYLQTFHIPLNYIRPCCLWSTSAPSTFNQPQKHIPVHFLTYSLSSFTTRNHIILTYYVAIQPQCQLPVILTSPSIQQYMLAYQRISHHGLSNRASDSVIYSDIVRVKICLRIIILLNFIINRSYLSSW